MDNVDLTILYRKDTFPYIKIIRESPLQERSGIG